MRLLYTKPKLKNMSQGSRIVFARQFRLIIQDNVYDKLGLTGECKRRTMTRYGKSNRNPKKDRTREIADILDINYNGIKKYYFIFHDKNNINNDVDLFSFLSEHKNVKNNIFTPLKEMKENYAIEYMASVVWQPNRKITIIDGDYQGYLLNEKSTNANLYEARIEYDGQLYVFTFLNKEEYLKKEDINNILNTVIFDDKINNNEVSLSIKDNTLTSKGATIVIKNNTNMEYNYGSEYYLEKQDGSKWVTIEPKEPLNWNDILYSIKFNESKEYNEDWSYAYGELSKGKYRLVKNISLKDATAVEKETISVEFEI